MNWLGDRINEIRISNYINLIYNAEHLVQDECGYCFSIEGLLSNPLLTFIPLDPPIYQIPRIIWKKNLAFSRAEKIFLSYLKETVIKYNNSHKV